ncbi:Long-chain-fatty-acid--CoA ligase [Kordia sp. TARA_039_SRF]|jgi:4-hydroxyphenylpyruvate dioxygenase|nr:Long-chain-fatty-acid--CoA ligase [Kordia sp. TARA_039_SRF]
MNEKLIESDFLKVEYDFIEYYVGMAKMVVYWHVKALGFKVVAYCGQETGNPDKCSYYLEKNNIKLVITAASSPRSHKIVSFVDLHGNGIKKIGVKTKGIKKFFENAMEKGAVPINFPHTLSDSHGTVDLASLKIFDDNEIVLIDYDNYDGVFMPGYEPVSDEEWSFEKEESYLEDIDHIASALRINEIKIWETYFNNIFSSKTVSCFDERQKEGEKKIGMYLKVLQTNDKQMNNVLVEPDQHKSTQVQLFLDEHYGSGIQHIAFSSSNFFKSVEILRKNGVKFISFPDSYYNNLRRKYPNLDVDPIQKHGVLCDVVDDTLLFQVFTAPIGDRATFFYEIVQRVNYYEGFGLDNIYTLFEAMEEEVMMNK